MTEERIRAIFDGVSRLRVGVLGDATLDVYWDADMRLSELSRETPHHPLPIVRERMQAGAAGNVACNLAALKPNQVVMLTILGRDWRGHELCRCLNDADIAIGGMMLSKHRITNAYIKPMRHGISDTVYEDPRLDFENREPPTAADEAALIDALQTAATELDVLCVTDQLACGVVTPAVRDALTVLGAGGLPIYADSRDRIGLYRNVCVKPNEIELLRAIPNSGVSEIELSSMTVERELEALAPVAKALYARTCRDVIVTLGGRGCLLTDGRVVEHVPAVHVEPPLDICGAGDTFGAAFALTRTAGATLREAAELASAAASFTVQQLHATGTPSREEVCRRMKP